MYKLETEKLQRFVKDIQGELDRRAPKAAEHKELAKNATNTTTAAAQKQADDKPKAADNTTKAV